MATPVLKRSLVKTAKKKKEGGTLSLRLSGEDRELLNALIDFYKGGDETALVSLGEIVASLLRFEVERMATEEGVYFRDGKFVRDAPAEDSLFGGVGFVTPFSHTDAETRGWDEMAEELDSIATEIRRRARVRGSRG
jgi:hypothetical protein